MLQPFTAYLDVLIYINEDTDSLVFFDKFKGEHVRNRLLPLAKRLAALKTDIEWYRKNNWA